MKKRQFSDDSPPQSTLSWSTFKPTRLDARQVGICGEHLGFILLGRAGVREVYMVEGTASHYREKHGTDLDIDVAEAMLEGLFADPLMVSQGKRGELLFFCEYDEAYYLVVPVKVLQGEMWVSSLFKDNKARAERRWGGPAKLLYKRSG